MIPPNMCQWAPSLPGVTVGLDLKDHEGENGEWRMDRNAGKKPHLCPPPLLLPSSLPLFPTRVIGSSARALLRSCSLYRRRSFTTFFLASFHHLRPPIFEPPPFLSSPADSSVSPPSLLTVVGSIVDVFLAFAFICQSSLLSSKIPYNCG